MKAPLDRALFPQSLLRFLSTGERLGAAPHRMIDMFLASFNVQGKRRGELAQLAQRLQAGGTLATEATKHPGLFPAWLATLFRFGQKSGRMQDALDWGADELDREARTHRAVSVALSYPVFLFTIILALTTWISFAVAPQFRSILSSLNALGEGSASFDREHPIVALAGQVFLALSHWSGTLGFLLFTWIALVAIALWTGLPGHAQVHRGMRWLVPGVRTVDRHAHEGLVARLMSAGLTAGLPLPELLDELAELPGDHGELLRAAAARVRMGAPPAEAFARAEGSAAAPFAMALATALSGANAEATLARVAGVSQGRAADELRRLPVTAGPMYTLILGAMCAILPLGQFSMLFKLASVITAY